MTWCNIGTLNTQRNKGSWSAGCDKTCKKLTVLYENIIWRRELGNFTWLSEVTLKFSSLESQTV
jgi:hypothetical protein